MSFTHFALLAKFGDVNIPLEKCSLEYFGIAPRKANEKACLQGVSEFLCARHFEPSLIP